MFEEKTSTSHLVDSAGVASSTWYEKKKEKKPDGRKGNQGRPKTSMTSKVDGTKVSDQEVVEAIRWYRSRLEFTNGGGYQKLKYYLFRSHSFCINKKKVYRLCKENNLLLPRRVKKIRKKSVIAINRVITVPLSLWELDIKYCYIVGENRFFYLMAVIDVFLRYVVGYHIGLSCTGQDLVRVLGESMERMNVKTDLVVRSDNGPQMTSKKLMNYAKENSGKMIHELIPVNTPNKNAHIESFNSIIEVEFLQTREFFSYADGYSQTAEFINFYHQERIHSSLGKITPQEALDKFRRGEELKIKAVRL